MTMAAAELGFVAKITTPPPFNPCIPQHKWMRLEEDLSRNGGVRLTFKQLVKFKWFVNQIVVSIQVILFYILCHI